MGWTYYVIWECETKNLKALETRIKEFLTNSHKEDK
jgi:G:T-mismatch repair DNA endonuclease (very short patch repair protein)